MHILHILNDIRELGNGIINVAVDLACLQAKAGHNVAIASVGGEYEALLAQYGVKHFHLDQSKRPLNLINAARSYHRLIQSFQPAIVHAHMMTGVLLAWALRRSFHYRLVSTVHNEFQRSAILMGLADRVIAVSHAVMESMQRRGIPIEKLHVVRNGTVGSPRHGVTEQPVSLCRPAIATVAGMYHRKGISELITAFEQIAPEFPEAHLYLIGDGPDRPTFEAQAQRSSAGDRIHFEGFQPEPQRYLQSTDIFVLASHREPFGLVLSEAREMGCAIIASDIDGIPEALDDGKAGILVPPADSKTLANAITQLLKSSDQLNAWKHRAQQNLEWLSVARVHSETLAVYRELLIK
ncbi:glycosyltransferase family 4 protein [Leptothermofonsia sp. ETS-13]|uniref:glycosyltransferase family 4 protein n=1 Tax=Leptothermofonsia sp. ETS-13 TaxID=3035696 RepID=UPI003B9FEB53